MRWNCLLLLGTLALALAGCRGTPRATQVGNPVLIVTPAKGTNGRIVRVNNGARFVVISYSFGDIPEVDRRLHVYRAGLKVAEIKITGPRRDTNTIADIVAGECQPGDEVRED